MVIAKKNNCSVCRYAKHVVGKIWICRHKHNLNFGCWVSEVSGCSSFTVNDCCGTEQEIDAKPKDGQVFRSCNGWFWRYHKAMNEHNQTVDSWEPFWGDNPVPDECPVLHITNLIPCGYYDVPSWERRVGDYYTDGAVYMYTRGCWEDMAT